MASTRPDPATERGVAPLVAVVALVGLTVALAVSVLAFATAVAPPPDAPRVAASLDSVGTSAPWPDDQRLRVTHEGGDPVDVAALALVVDLPCAGASARLTGFPTARLTAPNVRGDRVFDGTYAGVDGELDATGTDGTWASGEVIAVRVAEGDCDLAPGRTVRVRVVHRPSGAVLADLRAATVGGTG